MKLVLGHNQFIGISHISEEKSTELEKKFNDPKSIYNLVEAASDIGYRDMIFETHPRMLEFLKLYLSARTFDMNFYVQVPYIHGYLKKINEKGLSGLVKELIRQDGLVNVTKTALNSMINLAKKDYFSVGASAIKFEIADLKDVNIEALLLHNVTTDLLLSLQVRNIFTEFAEYVKDNLGLNPGFTTVNFPLLRKSFENWNMPLSLVMTPININGYDMNPSKEAVESSIYTFEGGIMAMNVLGGGAFSIYEASNYLKQFSNIHFCVVGASSQGHLQDLFNILK